MQIETNLLTRKEKAIELGISLATMDRYIRDNKVQVIKIPGLKRRVFFLPGKVDEEI